MYVHSLDYIEITNNILSAEPVDEDDFDTISLGSDTDWKVDEY